MATNTSTNTASTAPSDPILWVHPSPQSTLMASFLSQINATHFQQQQQQLQTYHDLHSWSIAHVAAFWAAVWGFCGIRCSQPYDSVLAPEEEEAEREARMFPRPAWFAGARLNFAENLLWPVLGDGDGDADADADADEVVIVQASETGREQLTRAQLREEVRRCRAGLVAAGVGEGDRVAGYVGNHAGAVVAMLAATALGAIWTAVSPDTGVTAVLDRLVQIEPKVLFVDSATVYNGKRHDVLAKVGEIVKGLGEGLAKVVVWGTETRVEGLEREGKVVVAYGEFVEEKNGRVEMEFAQLQPDAPVYILYSSGTTGAPKCIVHGAIGTLIQHKKEHMLQSDLRKGDRMMYFTTCTWMMWHWMVSALASGVTLVLYDGSPFQYLKDGESVKDDLAMPKLIDELGITQFGTSAKYLSVLEQKEIMPREQGLKLETLKAVYSTGSPLAPSTFEYVYKAFGQVNLGSITGGTDIISLFGAPCPLTPVYTGEIQVLGLGMANEAWDFEGKDVSMKGEAGELVCVKPFPCQPVKFWGAAGAQKYQSSYFEQFPGVWAHGDFVRFNPRTGGLWMLGRSDGILKPSGVRFGSAEIYNLLLKHFADAVEDGLCIGRRRQQDTDETVVLFVKMKEGVAFGEQLAAEIRAVVRRELSARHVPGIVDECAEIPVTANGKKVEGAVKQILSGTNVKTSASVVNAGCLDFYRDWAVTRQ